MTAELVTDTVNRIRPHLAGLPPEIQGAVLADLLAMWLAGHQGGDEDATYNFREDLLDEHLKAVRALIPVNVAMLKERS